MSDEKGEPTPTTPTAEAPGPDSRHIERLLSRAADSLGLIDVRRAERQYARIMDWLAARTPLLEQLRTRYGLTEGEGLTGLAFAEAVGREGVRAGGEAVNLSASPVGFTAPAAEPGFTAPAAGQLFTRVAHVPDEPAPAPAEAKRIARRGVPTFSPAGSETGPGAGASQGRGEVVGQQRVEVFKPALELAAPRQEQERPNQERARGLQSPSPAEEIHAATAGNEIHAAAVGNPGARSADAAQTSRPIPGPNPAQESVPLPTLRTVPSVEEQRATASTAEQDKTLARAEAPFKGEAGSAPPDAPRPNVARGSAQTYDAAGINHATDANEPGVAAKPGAVRVVESPGPGALTPALPAHSPVGRGARPVEHGQVAAASAAAVKLPVAGETRAASASAEAPRTLAQAREIHAGDSAGLASASLHAQPPLPLAPSHAAVERAEPPRRQDDSAPAVTRASSSPGVTETFTPGHARAQARADEANVRRLTEQVSRHLARRLLVERERRGWGRK